jgi:hypothetical protein
LQRADRVARIIRVRTQLQDAILDEILAQTDLDRRLFTLRAAHPDLAYELDELARTLDRARERVALALFGRTQPVSAALPSDTIEWTG